MKNKLNKYRRMANLEVTEDLLDRFAEFIAELEADSTPDLWQHVGRELFGVCNVASGDACQLCDGRGVRVYPSTATWRGGMGGARTTVDVCNGCWGSGLRGSPGVNLIELEAGLDG